MKINASFITCQTESGVAMLGFADDEFNTTQFLLLQRTLEPDQQDCALGHDRVHIQLNERSSYGDIKEVVLEARRAIFRIDPVTATSISEGETIEVAFDVSAPRLNEMAAQLRLLIGQERVRTPPSNIMLCKAKKGQCE